MKENVTGRKRIVKRVGESPGCGAEKDASIIFRRKICSSAKKCVKRLMPSRSQTLPKAYQRGAFCFVHGGAPRTKQILGNIYPFGTNRSKNSGSQRKFTN